MAARRCAVYRLFNATGDLLYVGVSYDPQARFSAHRASQPWWDDVDVSRTALTWFPYRHAALTAETEAIRIEHPRHNNTPTSARTKSIRHIKEPAYVAVIARLRSNYGLPPRP